MPHEVKMPQLGMTQDSGRLVAWKKQLGDVVAVGDVLFEVETDKSTMEIEATHGGYLAALYAQEDTDVPVGRVIALISDEKPDSLRTAVVEIARPELVDEPPQSAVKTVASLAPLVEAPPVFVVAGRVLASPKARRLAAEAGLDISRLAGAGVTQPFHASDIETLKSLAVPKVLKAGTSLSYICAELPAGQMDDFLIQMRDEGGVELGLEQVVVVFSAGAWRRATDARQVTIGSAENRFFDPDMLRLSAIRSDPGDEPCDLMLRLALSDYLTSMVFGGETTPLLCLNRTPNTFFLSLGFSETDLSADQAIFLMHELTQALANPILALV